MILTAEHIQAAKRGETVRLTADDVEIVVLRADVFDKAQQAAADDWTDEELRAIAARTFEDADQSSVART
jgi:hypothetical protein